jgi:predicted transcriptional regulator
MTGCVTGDFWLMRLSTAKSIIERKKDLRQLVSVTPEHKVSEAFKLMKEKGLTQLPVLENNTLVGSMSEL